MHLVNQRKALRLELGKVASQTLEATIRKATARPVKVERHHYLSDTELTNFEYICRLPGIEADSIDGVMHQLTLARAVRTDLDAFEPGNVWVLSGVRDPLQHSWLPLCLSQHYPISRAHLLENFRFFGPSTFLIEASG